MIGLKKISSVEKAPFLLSIRDFIQLDQAEFLHDVAGNIDSTSRKPTYCLHEFLNRLPHCCEVYSYSE